MSPYIYRHAASRWVLAFAVLGAGMGATTAMAAQATPPASSDEAPPAPPEAPAPAHVAVTSGNEIIVTATKRETSLQNVPVAVSVTTASTIERAHIRDIKDLASVVPSLRVVDHQNSVNTSFLIRGFGNGDNNAGVEPSVGVFIDGVYRSRSAAQIADFPDVSRVEVLRGPQSTLFGKNASAGVISITTAEPQFKTQGSAEVSYGNYNAVVAKAAITGGLTDTLAASISGGYNRRDGYVHDAGLNTDMNNRNRWFVRGQLLWAPDGGPRVRIIGDYGRINEKCCAVSNVLAGPTAAVTNALAMANGMPSGTNAPSNPYGDVYSNAPSTNDVRNYGLSAQADYQLGPVKLTSITAWRKTRAITNQDSDFTGADLLADNYADLRINTFTQELRATAAIGEFLNALVGAYYFNETINQTGQLQWGKDMRAYANALVQSGTGGAFNIGGQNARDLELIFGSLDGNPYKYAGTFFAAGTGMNEAYRLRDESISIFSQADVKLGHGITLTGGLNYTHDGKNFATNVVSNDVFSTINFNAPQYAPLRYQALYGGALAQGLSPAVAAGYAGANMNNPLVNPLNALVPLQYMPQFLNVPNSVEPGHTEDGNVSYTARLAWKANEHINTYLSYATGFKASSFNMSRDSRPALADMGAIANAGLSLPNLTSGSRYALPEHSRVYEAGLKANWGVVSANLAVFREEIHDFQTNLFIGNGFYLGNAQEESVNGFELEGVAHPVPQLTLTQSLTYLKAKYDKYTLSAFGDLSGATPAGIAPVTLTLAAEWNQPVGAGDHLILRGDWHYESSTQIEDGLDGFITTNPNGSANYTAAIAAARQFRREVSEVDASITYQAHCGLEFALWARNLTNDRYLTVVFDTPAQPASVSAYTNTPRTYGVSAQYRF